MKEVINWIENAKDSELMDVVNEVNAWNGSLEEYHFYDMSELDDLFYGIKPTELLAKLDSEFCYTDEGFRNNTIYGLVSCSMDNVASDIRDNAEEVAEALIDANDEHDLDFPDDLQELLDNAEV